MSEAERISRSFYSRLGAEGLGARTRPEWDQSIVAALIELLPADARVLDVGCGYGRIALPLVKAGFDVVGIDISPTLIEAACASAESEGLRVQFTLASMLDIPYPDESFDAVVCLWSTFHELLAADEQAAALREFWRVLRVCGVGLVEGLIYQDPTRVEIESGSRRGPGYRISWDHVEGLLNPHYQHDSRSFAQLCESAGISRFEVFERNWGGRTRLFLRLDKPRPA